MKKILFSLCLTCCLQQATLAQNIAKGNGHVFGVVMDSVSRTPVEFATIAIIDPATNKPIDGAVCDAKGKFSITKLGKGSFEVSISFIGFETKKISIAISDKKIEIDLGVVAISPSAKMLKEITIKGQKALVEEKVDRMVYNAENDLTTKGGDATDVLKRVPLLSVDMDGNISLKGSSNVKVLINNKPSTITASSVADALKQISADMIKSIEVITSPSSKYDAEGSAGIINIVLKKNTLDGVFFTADGSAGNRGSNINLSGDYRKGKMGFSASGFYRGTYNIKGYFHNSQLTQNKGDTLRNIQHASTRGDGYTSQYSFGWDYTINKNNSLTASVRYGEQSQNTYQDQLSTQTFRHDSLKSSNLNNVKTTNVGPNVDASLTYTKMFSKKDRQFDFLAIYSLNAPTSGFVTNTYSEVDNSVLNSYKNKNQGKTEEVTLQADFLEPIMKNQTLEFGAKDIVRNVTSDYQYLIAPGSTSDYIPATNASSNSFKYNQSITSGYLSYTLTTAKDYAFKVGGRYEYTNIHAKFYGQSDINIPSYGVLVPSINISRKLKNGNMIRIAYNRRIQRPSLRDLNPNLQASNRLNATMGNPTLKPEYTDNYEIAYKTFVKSTSVNLTTYLRNNTNDIQQARIAKHDTIISIYQNIGTEANYGVSIFVSIPVTTNFSLNGGVDMYYRILKNNSSDPIINATNKGLVKNFRVFGNYNFTKGWALQFFAFFQGRNINLQGYRTNPINHSLAVKKDLWSKNGSVGFGLDNFMTPAYNVHSDLKSAYLAQSTTNALYNFIVRINFSYKMGKLNPVKKSKKLGDDEEGQ